MFKNIILMSFICVTVISSISNANPAIYLFPSGSQVIKMVEEYAKLVSPNAIANSIILYNQTREGEFTGESVEFIIDLKNSDDDWFCEANVDLKNNKLIDLTCENIKFFN